MPFTRNPTISVEQTKPVPLLSQWETRSTTGVDKDVDTVNIIWDKVSDPEAGEFWKALSREGFNVFTASSPPSSEVYGMFGTTVFGGGVIVCCGAFGTKMYDINGAILGTSVTVAWGNRQMGFTEFQYENGTVVIVISDGVQMALLNGAVVLTAITDPDFPATHRPYPVYMDGYLFIADTVGNIMNSVLNDPTSWVASNFLSVDAYPDPCVALARHGAYVVAFGTASLQFFYDAGNPTGSPLAVYSAASPAIGYAGGLKAHGDALIFIGIDASGNNNVFKLTGFKAVAIGGTQVARYLRGYNPVIYTGAGLFRQGHIIMNRGHTLYTWTDYTASAAPTNPTWALDLDTGVWVRLHNGSTSTVPFPFRTSAVIEGFKTVFCLYGNAQPYGFVGTLNADNGSAINCKFVTSNTDFSTRRIKFGARMIIDADQCDVTMSVSWSDDDYQTWSTARTVALNSTYPHLHALGSFRKRAIKLEFVSDSTLTVPTRVNGIELDYIQGNA